MSENRQKKARDAAEALRNEGEGEGEAAPAGVAIPAALGSPWIPVKAQPASQVVGIGQYNVRWADSRSGDRRGPWNQPVRMSRAERKALRHGPPQMHVFVESGTFRRYTWAVDADEYKVEEATGCGVGKAEDGT